jgi:uncharacterized protein (DUF362 family)
MKNPNRHPCGSLNHQHPISRRKMLKMLGSSAMGLLSPSAVDPIALIADDGLSIPTANVTCTPARVSIAQMARYDQRLVRRQVQALLDNLGGLNDIVRRGDRVAIKVNLTGGTAVKALPGISPLESYVTHFQVVRALGELLRDAGASRLYIVEGIFDARSYSDWGYLAAAQAIDATLIDLNCSEPYNDFAKIPVGRGSFIYQDFTLHHLLEEVDTFVSVAKMKCHWWAGVTLSMKNLVGLAPVGSYNSSPQDLNRSAFHGDESITGVRLPRVIIDLNRARPIHLALIDGINTIDGGEGPWHDVTQVNAGVLIAGKNAVATDAVATAVMGFDPCAEMPHSPFFRGINHLNLASALRLGSNRLNEIEVLGTPIEAVQRNFRPCYPKDIF